MGNANKRHDCTVTYANVRQAEEAAEARDEEETDEAVRDCM